MSDHVIVRCSACSQKYRVHAASIGRNAQCKVCGATFVIGRKTALDDDTIVAWITQDAPASASVMGATGIFHEPTESGPRPPEPAPRPRTEPVAAIAEPSVILTRTNDDGAHFEFPASALASEDLRNAFPRRCVGCGAKHGLGVHLIYWPERVAAEDRARWRELQDTVVGKLEFFRNAATKALLGTLPSSRHVTQPFRLPFPVFACGHCHASREVRGHVATREGADVCVLTIASLSVAVEFYRSNGGRNTAEYHRLVEERDRRRDAWRDLGTEIRGHLSQWFEPRPGERFVHFFRDAEFSVVEAGTSGVVLTDRRLVFKKYAAHRDYLLNEHCRIEIKTRGTNAVVQIFEEGHRPAVFTLSLSDANELATSLRTLGCSWTITR
jgi:hypothetical protein